MISHYSQMWQVFIGTFISSIPLWIWIFFREKKKEGTTGLLGIVLINFKDFFKK